MTGKVVIFRLIDKNPVTWSIKDGTALKDGTLKNTHYRPGVQSIFDEDNEKSAVQPQWVTFSYNNNPNDPACELIVPEENKLLIEFLKSLYHFGKVFKIHDAKGNAELKAATFDKISEALKIVDETDELKLKAMAVAILGFNYFSMEPSFIKADLKEKAVKEASKIINAFSASDYQNKYLVSLAYVKGIIRNNDTNTAVIWANGGGIIMSVAVGDSPIEKMTELISAGTPQALTLLQELGVRAEKLKAENLLSESSDNKLLEEKNVLLSQKDQEIEDLKKQLAAKSDFTPEVSGSQITPLTNLEGKEDFSDTTNTLERKETSAQGDNVNINKPAPTLEEIQKEYVQLLGKQLPPKQKGDAGWLLSKIQEFKSQK